MNPESGCGFEICAETEDEIMRVFAEPAQSMHRMSSMPPETAGQIKAALQTVMVKV